MSYDFTLWIGNSPFCASKLLGRGFVYARYYKLTLQKGNLTVFVPKLETVSI